jgi:hypothetical protein
MYYDVVQ